MRVTASVLNVRSGPDTTFRVIGQLQLDERVESLERHGDWYWVQPPAGWAHGAWLVAEDSLEVPSGQQAIRRIFGLPGSAQCSSGRVVLKHPLKLSWSSAWITAFACHIKMEPVLQRVFDRIWAEGHWILLDFYGGCFADRPISGSERPSTHAWGIAVDLNTQQNRVGTPGLMPQELIAIFEDEGFVWGGRWNRPDPMHFQFATDY